METVNQNPIKIPMEFKISCFVDKISIKEVLQNFINFATVYDCFEPYYSTASSDAGEIMFQYAYHKNPKLIMNHVFENCKTIAATAIANIIRISRLKTEKTCNKRLQAVPHISNLFQAIERVYAPKDTIALDEETTLQLSEDFCVLCEIHKCTAQEFLEDFMSHISMADIDARKALKMEEENLSFKLFRLIAAGFVTTDFVASEPTATDLAFEEHINQLNLTLHHVKDLGKRTEMLNNSYKSYYLERNKDIVKASESVII